MSAWHDKYVWTNGIKTHYYRTGGDGPPVVFAHGAGDDGLCWTRVVKELEAEYDVVMVDARGHGLSDSGDGDYSSESRAADLAEAITVLDLDRPIIGGHSMGADTALRLAAERPGLVSGLFLEDPVMVAPGEPVFGGERGERMENAGAWMARILGLVRVMPRSLSKVLARRIMSTAPDDEVVPWVESKRRLSRDFINAMKTKRTVDATPVELLDGLEIPVMLFRGERAAGAIVSEETATRAAAVLPTLRVVHLEGAGHDIRRDRFDTYMASLRRFLAEAAAARD